MAKSDRVKQRNAELEAQEAQEQATEEVAQEPVAETETEEQEPKVEETEPVEQDDVSEAKAEESETEPEPETAEDLRKTAEKMRAKIDRGTKFFEATLKKANDRLAEIEAKAEAIEKAEAEAKAKAEAEEKALKEAEEKAKAEAEAREKAEAEAKAKAKADLLASVNRAERHVGKAYKWWDYESATWNIATDVWSANQLSDKWEVIYVWYKDGEIERLLNKEELDKYCSR